MPPPPPQTSAPPQSAAAALYLHERKAHRCPLHDANVPSERRRCPLFAVVPTLPPPPQTSSVPPQSTATALYLHKRKARRRPLHDAGRPLRAPPPPSPRRADPTELLRAPS
ncbi:lysine-rich arabinogalactan protein 19-like [Oryza glaberrima]|uniref:lysine-rich arabinogalactan protein 19-like n=1 Tax=Oryza glaberrima TaxID=4538 RepID=UPI00224C2C3C|nr:lysine-rich arabinogalactan protein 19-like [Oryza glaberrima]